LRWLGLCFARHYFMQVFLNFVFKRNAKLTSTLCASFAKLQSELISDLILCRFNRS